MANVTIPNLTSATDIAPSTDLMVLEQTNGTRKATLSQIFTSSATSGSDLGITSGGVYTIKSGIDSSISDINTLLGNTSIASIGDGTVTGAISSINTQLLVQDTAEQTITMTYDGYFTRDISVTIPTGYGIMSATFLDYGSNAVVGVLSIDDTGVIHTKFLSRYGGDFKFKVRVVFKRS